MIGKWTDKPSISFSLRRGEHAKNNAQALQTALTVTTPIPHFAMGFSSSLRFRVSEEMVANFASLTGDRSGLHVSEAFARRSMYRQPVVHGMLPVVFLSLVECLRVDNFMCSPTALSAQFERPVHVGDRLELQVALRKHQDSATERVFDYRIENMASKTTATTGSITVLYREGQASRPVSPLEHKAFGSLLAKPLPQLSLSSHEITKGDADGFDFTITENAIDLFLSILAAGLRDQDKDVFQRSIARGDFHFPSLLVVALFSTLVGMRLPGASATFLAFSVKLDEDIKVGEIYRLEGVVVHMSRATNILKTSVSVVANHGVTAEAAVAGKLTTLVNRRLQAMPSIGDLKASAMDMGLENKIVLITGASRGIGETTAKLFALYGARIVINYHRGKEDAERIAQEILTEGGSAIAIQADVTRLDQVQKMVAEAKERFGTIHVLVNNAVRDYRPIPFLNLTWDEIQKDVDVIAKGAFHCCREVIPLMLAGGGGKIINISSVAVDHPPADQTKYVLAKSALVGLTRSLSVEFASRNIQINLVVPSFVETDLVSHIQEGFRKKIADQTPMQRHASPVEVAQAVLFLASAHATFTTGQKIMVTGGGTPFL